MPTSGPTAGRAYGLRDLAQEGEKGTIVKYFTPRLYAKLNSSDAKKSLAAHSEWERAEARYETRLKSIRPRLPKSVRLLADELCLHDAVFLGCFPMSAERTIINVRTEAALFEMSCHHQRPVTSTQFALGDVFARQQPRWLYDEVDLIKSGLFSHEILLSNGAVLKCIFDEVEILASELRPLGGGTKSTRRKPLIATT
jgi:hypothetical protein